MNGWPDNPGGIGFYDFRSYHNRACGSLLPTAIRNQEWQDDRHDAAMVTRA